jgi:hypothetical protein
MEKPMVAHLTKKFLVLYKTSGLVMCLKFAWIEVYPESNTASMIIDTLAFETYTPDLSNSSLPSETELMGKSGSWVSVDPK